MQWTDSDICNPSHTVTCRWILPSEFQENHVSFAKLRNYFSILRNPPFQHPLTLYSILCFILIFIFLSSLLFLLLFYFQLSVMFSINKQRFHPNPRPNQTNKSIQAKHNQINLFKIEKIPPLQSTISNPFVS